MCLRYNAAFAMNRLFEGGCESWSQEAGVGELGSASWCTCFVILHLLCHSGISIVEVNNRASESYKTRILDVVQ